MKSVRERIREMERRRMEMERRELEIEMVRGRLRTRPESAGSEPSCVSFKSDQSKDSFVDFKHVSDKEIQQQKPKSPEPEPEPGPGPGPLPEPSCMSFKSDRSKDLPETFKDGHHSDDPRRKLEEPEPSCVSMKSDGSEDLIITFKDGRHSVDQRVDQDISEVPSGQSAQDSIFMGQKMETPQEVILGILEDLGTNDFEKFKWYLQQKGTLKNFPAIRKSKLENSKVKNIKYAGGAETDSPWSPESREMQRQINNVFASCCLSRLSGCNLSERSCEVLSSILSSQSSSLRELDLSNNNLHDSGGKLISNGLKSTLCTLETLSLSGCLISEEGCSSLVSALNYNPSHLRELDLSYNHPGDPVVMLLSAGLKNPLWRLDTLRVEPAGVRWLTPGLRKYSCELTLDTNTVNRNLKLSDTNRTVTLVKEDQSYPDHPERFDSWSQLLCRDGLTGRCYWEVERRGRVDISVSYRGISRRGNSDDCVFGRNDQSWSLFCSDLGFSVWHNNRGTSISSSSVSGRVAVYVDCPAGSLSFYSVSSDSLIHLHTFNTTFTQPLYPGFGFWAGSGSYGSSVSLCSLKEETISSPVF
ncbi:uncharacterized protein LOC118494665 [Sander lucioperca]|uniref:uncharacterized protein LOC118494665 n=1 Tax=Sander lucioperca TaxID=283035 RepID=UPI001653B4F4|nr:uncharacterized protein LOC118494665 [Sander lucioperca]